MCGACGESPTRFPFQRFYQDGWGCEGGEQSLACTVLTVLSGHLSGFVHARDAKLGALKRSMTSMVYLITQNNPPDPLLLF